MFRKDDPVFPKECSSLSEKEWRHLHEQSWEIDGLTKTVVQVKAKPSLRWSIDDQTWWGKSLKALWSCCVALKIPADQRGIARQHVNTIIWDARVNHALHNRYKGKTPIQTLYYSSWTSGQRQEARIATLQAEVDDLQRILGCIPSFHDFDHSNSHVYPPGMLKTLKG
jgi:hypothetical protein